YQSGDGYHVVPPPYTGTFMPPKPDLVFHNAPNDVESDHIAFNVELSPTKPNNDLPSVKHVETSISATNPKTASPKPKRQGNSRNIKACFVCKSLTYLIKDCDYHEKQMAQTTARNHAQRGNYKQYARMSLPNPQRHVVPIAVLTQSKLVPITATRPVTTVVPKFTVTRPRQAKTVVTKPNSPPRRHINCSPYPKANNFPPEVTTVKAPMVNTGQGVQGKWEWKPKCPILNHVSRNTSASMTLKRFDYNDGNLQHALKDKEVIDSGCSRHMTGNMSNLSNFEELNVGYVAFGGNPKGGKITGKGKIRTEKLNFDDVYFVKKLKFNLFSVLQMCNKKNSVLFTDTECLVLSPDFKLPDENQVLLRVPRENNMYNVNLKNIVPSGDLTCLFVKATLDESNLWHRRLGHINFKTMNKLVKGNLIRGLPSKVFENDHTCVACKKGKQHRASYKTKPVSSVNQPLQRLHMDLFRPTFVKSLNKKSYCLVVTDDYSLENQFILKVKIIRSDNGTEFKNNDLNHFYGMKGIKKEFSVPRTPQQNGIAERKNKTLIEAARNMLADSLLPIPFWAEAVNTACYVQNRVLVTKPQNKTPYELLHGRTPSVGFMRPFGYPVTILNTLDSLGKFDRKVDEGFLVGYSVSSKAFRVFNSRTRIVQETLHIIFLENKPNVAGSGPTWLFDIHTLTKTINYQPVTNTDGDAAFDEKKPKFKGRKPESKVNVSPSSSAHPIPTTRVHKDHHVTQIIGDLSSATQTRSMTRMDKDQGGLSQINNDDFHTCMFACFLSQEEPKRVHQALKDPSWIKAMQDELLQFKMQKVWVLVDLPHRNRAIGFEDPDYPDKVYKVVKALYGLHQAPRACAFLYGTIKEEVYVCQPPVFEDPDYPDKRGKIDQTLFIKWQKGDILLVQIYVLDIILGSTNKDLCKAFEKLMKDKFQMSSMGELTYFLGLQVKQNKDGIFISQDKYVAEILRKFGLTDGKLASTPTDTEKPLLKDPDGEDMDMHIYRSMIGSLMYLTSSRPDIMFAVCACAHFQVTPKASHLHAVQRIFRYLKGKPHLSLWYPKDSPFNLVAYSDSDYAGASLDRKSTTEECQFIGCILTPWQCKKQIVVATSSTRAEYVAAASCCPQVLWIQNQ
nr:retrovirus-related Pol polyprotein from transposon TNT 1-94 [Tanacetum cinerariifolium]